MLHNDPLAPQFVGGTVYQAFLSALNYHRWSSPINGKIVKIVHVPGTYHAESPAMGFINPDGPDPAVPNLSQGFITAVAARCLIFMEAGNPKIGLMCFIAVGMAEVSTCEATVEVNDHVNKGDELECSISADRLTTLVGFRPETKVVFDTDSRQTQRCNSDGAMNDLAVALHIVMRQCTSIENFEIGSDLILFCNLLLVVCLTQKNVNKKFCLPFLAQVAKKPNTSTVRYRRRGVESRTFTLSIHQSMHHD